MNKFLFNPLGMDAFKASTPCIAPLVAAGITAASGLASSIIGSSTQKSSNESYLKGVRETNQANKELYQMQVNDNRVNWAMESAYNTPAQQLARLRQAGINGSSVDASPYGSIQSSSALAQIAPEQTPNPFGNLNLGGITADAIQAYKSGQQIEDNKYNLYQHGIESLFFYRNQLNKARLTELEILSKETKNDYDYELLKQARIESKYYEERVQKQLREIDDNHDNLVKTGHKIDVEADDIIKARDLDEFRAQTERMLAIANVKRIKAEIDNLFLSNLREAGYYQMASTKHFNEQEEVEHFRNYVRPLEDKIKDYSVDEKKYAAALIMQEAIKNGWDTQSWFNEWMHKIFGFNLPNIVHGSAGVSISSSH